MLKKRTAILFLTLSYVILLVHNIIPHQHHDHVEHLTEHHDTDHHHDDEADNDGLNHLFAHFAHVDDGFSFITAHSIINIFSKQQLSFLTVLPDIFSLSEFLLPPLLDKPHAKNLIYISPHSHLYGLRAPPSILI